MNAAACSGECGKVVGVQEWEVEADSSATGDLSTPINVGKVEAHIKNFVDTGNADQNKFSVVFAQVKAINPCG